MTREQAQEILERYENGKILLCESAWEMAEYQLMRLSLPMPFATFHNDQLDAPIDHVVLGKVRQGYNDENGDEICGCYTVPKDTFEDLISGEFDANVKRIREILDKYDLAHLACYPIGTRA